MLGEDKDEQQGEIPASMIMTPEEEEVWLGKYFGKKEDKDEEETLKERMDNLEKEFEETMRIAAEIEAPPVSQKCAVRKVYSELHSQADADVVGKLRLAMEGIPEGTKGLEDCRTYFGSKQHYTLQDVLVAQYILNDGLLMRQNHGSQDEFHVDITEPLV